MNYSNPRREAVFTDWPYGSKRTTATFTVEARAGKGERVVRTTVDPKTGRLSAPKALTFAEGARIVDGDDGRTYLAMLSRYAGISIMRSTMDFTHENVNPGDPRYPALREMFDATTGEKS